jgi:hypothetical protein
MEWTPRLRVFYYVHAWQGLLMFLAGIICVLAAFAGYVKSGGAEELLRGALSNLDSAGRHRFDSVVFDWHDGALVVTNLRRENNYELDSANPSDALSGLKADQVRLKVDLFPWPPNVRKINVEGMTNTEVTVSQGFLQSGKLWQPKGPPFPVEFERCNLRLNIGDIAPLQLSGCSGEIRSGSMDDVRGAFSLSELNGKPFNLKLETLEDGQWLLTGENIQLNTRDVVAAGKNSFGDKLDPVGLLVRSLFSGEMGAEGIVSSLRIAIQPATATKSFSCDGEVGYKDLEFRLPSPEKDEGQALPYFLDQLLGAEKNESIWPRWMQVDRIKTGKNGRVHFHMVGGKLEFACDEGAGSAFTGSRGVTQFPPLESLKGSVETDTQGRPHRIVVRGFLGDQLSFETRTAREKEGSRTYEMLVEPRGGDSEKLEFKQSIWRFKSVVKDYLVVESATVNARSLPLAEFEVEADARHFPKPDLLPIGMQNVSGHMYAKGRFGRDLLLHFDTISLDDGAGLIYGNAPKPASESSGARSTFGPFWEALMAVFGTDTPWQLHDLSLRGEADVQFELTPRLHWKSTTLKNFKLDSGTLEHANRTTDVGVLGLQLSAQHSQTAQAPFASKIQVSAGVPGLWDVKLEGEWKHDKGQAPSGDFTLREENVPFLLHPQRDSLDAHFVSEDKRRMNRTTIVHIHDQKVEREVKP